MIDMPTEKQVAEEMYYGFLTVMCVEHSEEKSLSS